MGYDLMYLAELFPHDLKRPDGIESLNINFGPGQTLSATTEPIIITSDSGSTCLGQFRIEVPLPSVKSRYDIRIIPLDKAHPHISDELACWGHQNGFMIDEMIAHRDWEAMLSACISFLKSYNPTGAYFVLFGEEICRFCDTTVLSEDISSCVICGSDACSNCMEGVETGQGLGNVIWQTICISCYETVDYWCPECEDFTIDGSYCRYCGRRVHDRCQEDHEGHCGEKACQIREARSSGLSSNSSSSSGLSSDSPVTPRTLQHPNDAPL